MHDPSPIFIIMFVFGMIAIAKGRFGRYGWMHTQRRLEQEIADLRAQHRESGPARGVSADHVQLLEDRVRVLERIVTDQNYSLARDIEALRDTPRKEVEEGSKL